jgi:hypothetical protein
VRQNLRHQKALVRTEPAGQSAFKRWTFVSQSASGRATWLLRISLTATDDMIGKALPVFAATFQAANG